MTKETSRYKHTLVFIILALSAGRIFYIAYTPFDLSPDEAHYWEWSRRLDLSYYSKGPFVAYVIGLFTSFLGAEAFAVRIGAVVFSGLTAYFVYLFGKEVFKSEEIGFWSALAINAAPVFSIGAVIMTTDVIFAFFWTVSLYYFYKAVINGEPQDWHLGGFFTGLGFLSKYTMVLIYPCLALYLFFVKEERRWFKNRRPYEAALISLVISGQVIVWNILHGQVTIKHTLGQVHAGSNGFSAMTALEFLGSQLLLVTPLIFIALVYGVWRAGRDALGKKDRALAFVFFASAPLFFFFLLKSFHGKVQANWAAPAYVAAVPAAVWAFVALRDSCGFPGKRLLNIALIIAAATGVSAAVAAHFPWTLEYAGFKDVLNGPPYNRVLGWKELGDKVGDVQRELGGDAFILSDTYQITSELAFYVKDNPPALNVDTGERRMNQYDLWPGMEYMPPGSNAVYVKGGPSEIDGVVADSFERCSKETFFAAPALGRPREYTIFRCRNFKGLVQKTGHTKF